MIRILVLVAVVLGLQGCLQENDCPEPEEWQQAVIVFAGEPEVDGCGWLISVNDTLYHPVNLDDKFRITDLGVRIKYVPDPEVFRCGRGGIAYPSIRITAIESDSAEVGILREDQWNSLPMDGFHLDTAYIEGDMFWLRIGYSGGCKEHELKLWKLPPQPRDNPPIELLLAHNANGDMCEAYITRWLTFSLIPLRINNENQVTFFLRGSPEMSAYYGQFIYKY